MPDFTFAGPGGKEVTITGPEGSTREQAIAVLHQHLGGQPTAGQAEPTSAVDSGAYHSKLIDTLDALKQHLAPSWSHNPASYSPYKPAQPGNMPNDAINPVGNDTQATIGAGAVGGAARLAANIPRPPQPPPPQPPVNMNQMPTQQSIQNNAGLGGQTPPSSPVNPGVSAQQGFLRQAASEAAKKGGMAVADKAAGFLPWPANHLAQGAIKFAPKVLGLEK